MANTLVESFRIKGIRKKIFYTIGILIISRIGAMLPIPGINPAAVLNFFSTSSNSFTEYLNFFSGGAFANFSIFMLGVMPYISTQIIVQLLMVVIPSMKKLASDPQGAKKIQQYTRYGTVLVCVLQGAAASAYARGIPGALAIPVGAFFPVAMISVTAGSMLLVWLGDRITQKGIGNGISLMIFAGIAARIPSAIYSMIQGMKNHTINPVSLIVVLIMFFFVVALVIYEEKAKRKIKVVYSGRTQGNKMYKGQESSIPLKINPSGVIPVIFASALLTFPLQLGYSTDIKWLQAVANFLNPQGAPYIIIYTLLILGFAMFYTTLVFNPTEVAENIRAQGGMIPGVGNGLMKDKKGNVVINKETGKPRTQLEAYLAKVTNRIAFSGAIFLAFIALIPTLVQLIFNLPSSIAMLFGGTSLIILVGVDIDIVDKLEEELASHRIYKEYCPKKRKTNKM